MEQTTKYIPVSQIHDYLKNKTYTYTTRTTHLKNLYGKDNAKEIVYSGNYVYAIWW